LLNFKNNKKMKNFNDSTPMTALSIGQLKDLIDLVLKTNQVEKDAPLPEVFGKKVCSRITGYSVDSINKFICGRNIPYYKKNGRVLFRRDEVLEWLLCNPVKTLGVSVMEMENDLFKNPKK